MLNTNWTEVEVIELLVDSAASLGFGMCGSKSTGTVVRHIHAGGAAEMDGRLRLGDHIVCVQDFNVRGFGPDQVATVLRHTISAKLLATGLNPEEDGSGAEEGSTVFRRLNSDSSPEKAVLNNASELTLTEKSIPSVPVRLIVARSALADPNDLSDIYIEQQRRMAEQQVMDAIGVVPTEQLDEYLEALLNTSLSSQPLTDGNQPIGLTVSATQIDPLSEHGELCDEELYLKKSSSISTNIAACKTVRGWPTKENNESTSEEEPVSTAYLPIEKSDLGALAEPDSYDELISKLHCPSSPMLTRENAEDRKENIGSISPSEKTSGLASTDFEQLSVILERPKDEGLGLIVVGYVYRDPAKSGEYTSGIFVQSLATNSVADKCGQIRKNDQIIQVNNEKLLGLENLTAVSILKTAGSPITLHLRRHKHGFLFEHLRKEAVNACPRLVNTYQKCKTNSAAIPMHLRQTDTLLRVFRQDANFIESPMIVELTECLEHPSTCNQMSSTVEPPVLGPEETLHNLDRIKDFDSSGDNHNANSSAGVERFGMQYAEKRRKTVPSLSSYLDFPVEQEVDFYKFPTRIHRNLLLCKQTSQSSPSNRVIGGRITDPSIIYAGEVTPELEELMRNVWQPLIGPDCDVIVLHIKKPKSASSLGISVEGVDWVRKRENFPVANGGELTEPVSAEPRHFVQSIVPGGLLGSLNIIQPGDELLQVNGRRLRGMSRTSTVRCLRNLPSHIELVLSRARQPTRMFAPEELALLSAHGEEPPLEVMASEVNSVDTTYSDVHLPANSTTMLHNVTGHPPTNVSPRAIESRISEWVRRSVVDLQGSSAVTNSHDLEHLQSHKMESGNAPYPAESHSATLNERRSYLESFRHLHHSPQKRPTDTSHLATMPRVRSGTYRVQDPRYKSKRPVWSSVPLLVQLTKSERGFGFSLSEYEELPVSETESRRRRISLTLGRRHSNRHSPFSSPHKFHRSATLPRMAFSSSRKGYILLVDGVVPNGVAHQDGRISIGDRLLFINDRNLSKATLQDAVRALKSAPNGPCLLGISKMHLVPNVVEEPNVNVFGNSRVQIPPSEPAMSTTFTGYEPLYVNTGEQAMDDGQAASFPLECSKDHPLNFHVLPEDYQQSDLHDPYLDVPPVEKSQEKFTQIVLLSAPIGIKLDALAARGQDGCRIVQIFDGGAVCRSNVLQPNDYITELDGHSMRHVTNLEAFQLLRHSSSRDGTVDITYFPAEVIAAHRSKFIGSRTNNRPIGFVQDSEKNGRAESYTEPFGFIEQVIISRNADESSWGLNLAGEEYLPALPENVKAHLFNPTCVQSIKPDSPAERCGCLQPGDIILKIADTDVVHAGPAYVRHLLQDFLNQGTTQVSLGVRFSTVAPTSEEVNNKSTTVAEVERRSSLADRSHSLAPGDRRFSKGIDELDREDSPSSFSQVEAPEPLSEMDSRDELNVLSRSIESPVHRIGTTADSGVGQQDDDDIVPLSSLACPVLPDESVASESLTVKSADKSATDMNGTVNAFRVGAGLPPAPPTRRFSRETAPFSVEDSISNLPVITKDPVSLYERDEPAGDKVIPVEIELPWPLVNGSGDMPSPKFESLGIHLVGSIHPNLNATYVAGLTPGSVAAQSGTLQVGDEVVQVGQNSVVDLGRLMVGRCITRAVYQSIKRAAAEQDPVTPTVFLVVRRNPNNMKLMASITSPDRSTPEHPFGLTNGLILDHPEERTQSSFHLGSGDESELLTPPVSTIPLTSSVNHLPVSQDLLVQVHALLDESPDLYDIFDTEIQRNSNGYGIFIVNYGPQDKPGVFVSDLAPNGAAAQHGELCPNDRILAVNGQIQTDYDSTLSLMKQSTTRVRLTIARRKAATQSPSKAVTKPVATSSPAPSALTNAPLERPKPPPIIPGRETLVELTRHSGSSWGFSVVGGKDTVLRGILVHAVHDDGIVAEDGRIAVGDRLLAVNGVDLRDADHETGKKIIRNAGDSLRLLIYREPPTCLGETEQPQEIEVTIVRKPGESLGLSLFGRSPYSTGTAIAAIVPGTPAAQCGLLKPGDVVLEINGLDYRLAQYQEVAAAFKAASGEVRLKVQREPPSSHPTHPPPVPSHRLKLYVVVLRRSDQEASRTIGFQHALLGSSNLDSSFGLSIRQASPEEVLETGGNLIVEDILPGSPAALSIMIQPGDRLLTVDREPVDWLRPDEVFSLLSGLTECTLELGRLPVAPYPVDPGLSTACFPQDEQPPYPCSVELPEIFDVEMPIIEPPPGVRSMDTLEEEKPRTNFNPGDLSIAKKTHLSSASSSISSTDEAGQIAQRSAAGFQVRQVCLPPALPGSTLGIRLAKAHGISGPVIVRIMPDSVASQTPLRVGDRILGLDDKLLLLLDSDTTPRQLLARIKEAWLARGSSLENPVRLTVVGASDHQTQNGGVSSESENDRVPATSTMNDGFPTETANPRSLPKINGPLPASRNPPNSQSYPTLHGLVVYGREEDEGTLAVPGAAPATYTGIKRTSLS